jgi:membrane-associated phospholipid phosphatase
MEGGLVIILFYLSKMEKVLVLMPIILLVGSFVFGITENNNHLIALSIGILLCIIVAKQLKDLMPKKGIYLRPTDDPCHCGILNHEDCKGIIGMPSEHAIVMAFFFTSIYLESKSVKVKMFAFTLAMMVIIQRYISKCHSALQLTIGAIVGSVLAVCYKYAMKKIM